VSVVQRAEQGEWGRRNCELQSLRSLALASFPSSNLTTHTQLDRPDSDTPVPVGF